MSEMTMDEALDWLRKAVDTQGRDFVYNPNGGGCFYLPQERAGSGDPRYRTGCLIGTAMKLAGRQITADMENRTPTLLSGEWNLSMGAAMVLQRAQQMQDAGDTWGKALDSALKRAEAIRSWDS